MDAVSTPNLESVARCLTAIWQTRSLKPISRSFSVLRDLSLKILREGNVNSREFRFCVKRLQKLAACPEFAVPPEYFEPITALVISVIAAFPAATDQMAQYLRAVNTTPAQLDEISNYLQDPKKSPYTWQNYKLWVLLVQKEYCANGLMKYARQVVRDGVDNASRYGATLYLGALGAKDDRIVVAENFSNVKSFLGQRIALVAIQELHYSYIRNNVQPFLRDDLRNVYKALKQDGNHTYVAPPEVVSITSVLDVERDYE